jgi:hypothetical protein
MCHPLEAGQKWFRRADVGSSGCFCEAAPHYLLKFIKTITIIVAPALVIFALIVGDRRRKSGAVTGDGTVANHNSKFSVAIFPFAIALSFLRKLLFSVVSEHNFFGYGRR